ncbi:MarR family transcriptional regulator [Alginatibacterium sediminis]|uniref:MarR family transcriptional regulator n=1 Tax=Alginatibacterium sediminis TaxID=2164068 RepID=A0A420EA43_9ALTE|nr:MarR family winged helix-turn-helix transcriptional regulator [Alginatibacterium sediminis]RKF17540.1 MarR family transcriptional regulator [Alginatibacterium sediminis]
MENRDQTEARLIMVMGIVQQLMDTRKNILFSGFEINVSQFGLLSHFSHTPSRSWTISELATVMEMNQPGITKLVSVLLDKGLLSAQLDSVDKRKRHLSITSRGVRLCGEIMVKLQPEITKTFSALQDQELQQMLTVNEKLMAWLDTNRL